MHSGEDLPRVGLATPMREVIYEMSAKRLGVTGVVDEHGRLAGVISDGDLRRLLERHGDLLERRAGECMQTQPKTIAADELASAALQRMEDFRITSLFVCDAEGRLQGVVHLHDLWGLELF